MTTGERIKNRRLQLQMSVDSLAEKVGVNRVTIYRYENGDIESMSTDVLEPLAKALCTTPMYLMGWEDAAGSSSTGAGSTETGVELNRSELTLIDNYRELNEEGQEKLTDYASDLVASGRYKIGD